MGLIKGGLLIISSIALVILLFVSNIFLTLDLSLEHDIIAPEISSVLMQFNDVNSGIKNISDFDYFNLLNYCLEHPDFLYKGTSNIVIPCATIRSGISDTLDFLSSASSQPIIELSSSVDKEYNYMLDYCQAHENVYYKNNITNFGANVSCSNIIEGRESVENSIFSNLVDEVYYGTYECDFWNCFDKTGSPFFLVSQKAKDYWAAKFYYNLIFVLIAIALVFLFIENKFNLPILVGAASIISAFLIVKIDWVIAIIIKPILKGADMFNLFDAETLISILMVFFSKAGFVFWLGIIIGILLIVFGIGFRFWMIFTGNNKKMFSKEEVKNIIKKEVGMGKKKKGNSKSK